MIDLHVHSNYSDGSLSPAQLIDYASQKGLSAFALTDHDTVDGLYAAREYLDYLHTQKASLENREAPFAIPRLVDGIELSTEYQKRDIHILGLFIDKDNQTFRTYLERFVESRVLRNQKMCQLLTQAGIDISYEKLLEEFPGCVITRAHYASYMIKRGYIGSMNEAFERYIGDHSPYFVPREKVTPAEAVELILTAGGVPILAHPILYHMSDERLDTLVCQLKEVGLMGIEAIYSSYNAAEERQIRRLASKYNLYLSGGSDFHGSNKPGLDLGNGYGHLYVPDQILEELERAHLSMPHPT